MPGIIRSPLDMPHVPMQQDLAPPIIPRVTQMAPGQMRAVMRKMYGMDEDEEMAPPPHVEEEERPCTPPELMAKFGKLFYEAGEYPGLQEAIQSLGRAMMKAQRESGLQPSILRMPRPITSPPPIEADEGLTDLAPRPMLPLPQ